jgi:Flp pilus assembly pilin Flp
MRIARRFLRRNEGATAVEYAVLVGMVALIIVSLTSVGSTLNHNYFSTYAQNLRGGD